jgi:inorganic pyrophosphatase
MEELTPGPKPPDEIYVLVHVSTGSRYYYRLPKEQNVLVLGKSLEVPLPTAYGIIPQTHHVDGEPLDVFVLTTEPPVPGSLVPARPVGMVRLEGEGKIDDKVIAVCSLDKEFEVVTDIADVQKRALNQLERAIKEDWVTKITWSDVAKAKHVIERAIELYKREFG